ncbi:GntR family transcriptional regulator [Pseudovibrio exalbescens]|uniref:GntR family transcriptional regulator n=1 Tax=Pseudovibrio exalbescens TaxID=197461 RepID=UPI000C9BAEA2|nr:GntR family transcriptional regulator [Pseudovibrio exalbescens]
MENETKLENLVEAFSALSEGSVSKRVYEALKRAVVQLQLQPGNLLSEADVAKRLGVSRQPVREAFIKLADVGLLEVRPQRGTFVVPISRREVENARFLREAIEVALVRKAAQLPSLALVKELDRLIELQELAQKHNDNAEFLKLDEKFHCAIAMGVNCEMGWRIVVDMKAQMDRVRYLSLGDATPIPKLIEQHKAIVRAIEAGNAQAAQGQMEIHLQEILKSLPAIEEGNPTLFSG